MKTRSPFIAATTAEKAMLPTGADHMTQDQQTPAGENEQETVPVTMHLRPDMQRAFRRCVWIITHETGRDQVEIMQEMVQDFLIKHGC